MKTLASLRWTIVCTSVIFLIFLHDPDVYGKPADSMKSRAKATSGTSAQCPAGQLYWEETKQCFESGVQGPCGKNMTIGPSFENPLYGRCDCQKYEPGRRGLEFDPSSNACYEYFTQGPCTSQDKWLALKDGKPTCDNNPCLFLMNYEPEESDPKAPEKIWVVYNDECVEVGQPSDDCDTFIALTKQGTAAECHDNATDNAALTLTQKSELPCPINMVKRSGTCEPVADFGDE